MYTRGWLAASPHLHLLSSVELAGKEIVLSSRRGALQRGLLGSAATFLPVQKIASAQPAEKTSANTGLVNVRDFGARGDGKGDDTAALQAAIDDCFGPAANPHSGPNAHLNKPLYFPPGTYRTTAPLLLTSVRGGHIFGAGRFSTSIVNAAGTSVLRTNGFEFNRVEMLRLSSAGRTADVLDLDWTHTGRAALQSNTFADMRFDGGAIGANIGKSDFMGSENLFLNCFFGPHAVAGLRTSNFNALQNTLIGGNIQSCPIGVWVRFGSCSVYNTGFQISNTFDIVVDNSANDCMVVSGVRSESRNFIQFRNGITAHIIGCSHFSNSDGIFADVDGSQVMIDSCVSARGLVKFPNSTLRMSNSSLARSDWLERSSSGICEINNCYGGGTRNTGFGHATFFHQKTITSSGTQWRPSRLLIEIKPESSVRNVVIEPGTRIQRVTLVIDKPAVGGIVRVGDSRHRTRYFPTADLAGDTVVSPTIEYRYSSADSLTVESTNPGGAVAHIAVDFTIES